MKRRSFIKGIAGVLFAPKFLKSEKSKPVIVANAQDEVQKWPIGPNEEILGIANEKIIYRKWYNRWWKFQGNLCQWTNLLDYPGNIFYPPLIDELLTEWNYIPTMDMCADACIHKDSLIWVGKHGEIWQIEHSEPPSHFIFIFIKIKYGVKRFDI